MQEYLRFSSLRPTLNTCMFQFFLALLAGTVTVGGPCILPLLPIILGTSTAGRHPLRPFAIVLGFVLAFTGFALIFQAFGSFLGLSPSAWRYLASFLIAGFGLLLLFPNLQARLFAKLEPLVAKLTPNGALTQTNLVSGFVLGFSLGAVWTPCAGPVLGSILTLVAAKQNLAQAGALLFAFSLGAGVPMLLIAYGGQYATQHVKAFTKYTGLLQKTFGVIILLVALGLVTGLDQDVQAYLLTHYPWLFLGNTLNI